MVWDNLKPSDILTKSAFRNAIVVNSAIGGSTNCPIHITAIARHIGVELDIEEWQSHGHDIPLLVNCQPAGEYLGEGYHLAGGVPAVCSELMKAGKLEEDAMTVTGKSIGENYREAMVKDTNVIRPYDDPLMAKAGFIVVGGNLFDAALMKTSVISDAFRAKYLSEPGNENAFEGRAIVFDGPEDYHDRINDPTLEIDDNCLLFIRGCGPLAYPGSAEVVNMLPPDALVQAGTAELPASATDGKAAPRPAPRS